MIEIMPTETKPDQGASPCGYHFINEYQSCPRRFFMHHILGLEPATEKPALLFGKAWHYLLELFLKTPVADWTDAQPTLVQDALRYLASMRSRYVKEDDFLLHKQWLLAGIEQWLTTTRTTLGKDFTVLGVEDDFVIPLADGFAFSVRTDGRVRLADGRTYVVEHKTTSWSVDGMFKSVDCGDQMSGYLLAYKRGTPADPVDGVLLDVTTFKPKLPMTEYSIVTRASTELVDFELSLIGLFTELRQKELALTAGRNPMELFPRNGAWCGMFGCPYEDICRRRVEQLPLPPTDAFIVRTVERDAPSPD